LFQYIDIIREILIMTTRLPAWRFLLLTLIGLLLAFGYVCGNLSPDTFGDWIVNALAFIEASLHLKIMAYGLVLAVLIAAIRSS